MCLRLTLQSWVQRIGANEAGLRQNVPGHGQAGLGAAESPFHRQFFDIERKYGKDVAMDNLIVPRRAGAIVAVVIAPHVVVAGKPVGVVVDALACAMCSLWPGFAARRNLGTELALLEGRQAAWQVDENPVEKVDTWQ